MSFFLVEILHRYNTYIFPYHCIGCLLILVSLSSGFKLLSLDKLVINFFFSKYLQYRRRMVPCHRDVYFLCKWNLSWHTKICSNCWYLWTLSDFDEKRLPCFLIIYLLFFGICDELMVQSCNNVRLQVFCQPKQLTGVGGSNCRSIKLPFTHVRLYVVTIWIFQLCK